MKTIFICFAFLMSSLALFSQNPLNIHYKGEPDGEKVYYYSNGQPSVKYNIVNGNLQGQHISYYKNGKLMSIENFDHGLFHGTNFKLNQNGDTTAVELHNHDSIIHYKDLMYYKSGELKNLRDVYFSDSLSANFFPKQKNGGSFIEYDINILINTLYNYGNYRTYYKSGKPQLITSAIKEQWNGPYIEYYENGQTKISANYMLGKLDGTFIEYNNAGKIIKQENYKNGAKL